MFFNSAGLSAHFKLEHKGKATSMDELLIQRSRLWVQSSVQQPSLLSEASNRPPLLFKPPAKANLKREDNASPHFLLQERYAPSQAQFLPYTHSSPRFPQRRLVFMLLRLCPLHTLDAQLSARSSVAADGVTLMFTATSSILFFVFLTPFGFTLFFMSCHFSCFHSAIRSKRQHWERRARSGVGVCVEQTTKTRGQPQTV